MKRIRSKIVTAYDRVTRYLKYGKYYRKYGFHKWHMGSKAARPYIKEIVQYICSTGINENTRIVECGCGLCDILMDKAFDKCQRTGVEKDEKVYRAIQKIYGRRGGTFINGSFQNIKGMKIDWFLAVNFTHEISDEEMRMQLKRLVEENEVGNLVLDEVSGNYQYQHHYLELLPKGYALKLTMGPYPADGGERYIKVFEKIWQ